MDNGDIEGAIARLESINDLNPNYPQTNYNLGIAYYKKGAYDKAIKSLEKAVKLNEKFSEAYYALGVIYEELSLNMTDKAKKDDSLKKQENIAKLIEYLKASRENYAHYLNVNNDSQDSENIKPRIESLNNDINHYTSLLRNAS